MKVTGYVSFSGPSLFQCLWTCLTHSLFSWHIVLLWFVFFYSSCSGHVQYSSSNCSPFMERGQIQGAAAEWLLAGRFLDGKPFKKMHSSVVLMTDALIFSFLLNAHSQRWQRVVSLSCSEFSSVSFNFFANMEVLVYERTFWMRFHSF